MNDYPILGGISRPGDIKKLNDDELTALCAEIRSLLVDTVSVNGGHLASNLGSVELTVAMHRCFDSPTDSLIWDVGHQAYAHKLLTGRIESFGTLRKAGGISGFTRPAESEHDLFYSGHAGVSVSQAAGVAAANEMRGSSAYAVAVIGDGSFCGGMVYEALNAAGSRKNRLIVILNDNEMSISQNVGALARYLARVRSKPEYYRFKAGTEKALNKIPLVGRSLSNHLFALKTTLKNIIYSSSFFEDLGFRYIGPIDGHDIRALCEAMDSAKLVGQPVVIHVNTVKGKGYEFAEKEPSKYHGVSGFDPVTGEVPEAKRGFSDVFGEMLTAFASKDKRICAVTAAMSIGTGLEAFAGQFPERFFDVGIAEEHALTFCAGLAAGGQLPVFAVYSTFFQRCFDQLMHDAALQGRKLVIALDRAGFVGSDGETHQGIYDVSMMSGVPGITVYSPENYADLGCALYNAFYRDSGVVVIRYPKGAQSPASVTEGDSSPDFSTEGEPDAGTVIVSYGRLCAQARLSVRELNSQGIKARLIKLHRVFPMSKEALDSAMKAKNVFFFEEGIKRGGAGEHFGSSLLERGYKGSFRLTAVDNCFVPQAEVGEQLRCFGFDRDSMIDTVKDIFKGESI